MEEKLEYKKQKNDKIEWITVLRAFACISVIIIHIFPEYMITHEYMNVNIGRWFIDAVFLQTIIRSAVPCFIMISGVLLLDPKREITYSKIKNYIIKTIIILLVFGFSFCLIENIFNMGTNNIPELIYNSILNLFQEKTWAHMWYLYMLIGLYIITPILREFVKHIDMKTVRYVLLMLFIITIIIPTVNEFLSLNITVFYLYSFRYIFIYMIGYYIVYTDIIKNKYIYIGGVIGIIGYTITSYLWKVSSQTNVFMILETILIIKLFSNEKIKIKNGRFINSIAKYSLGIYIVHEFWINILSKLFNIYPDILPTIIGETVYVAIILMLSYITSKILYKIPILKKIW